MSIDNKDLKYLLEQLKNAEECVSEQKNNLINSGLNVPYVLQGLKLLESKGYHSVKEVINLIETLGPMCIDSIANARVSGVKAVEKILSDSSSPMHINEIMHSLDITSRSKKISIIGTLNKYCKEGKIFTKNGPNTFWVIKRD